MNKSCSKPPTSYRDSPKNAQRPSTAGPRNLNGSLHGGTLQHPLLPMRQLQSEDGSILGGLQPHVSARENVPRFLRGFLGKPSPICSMYGIFSYIYPINVQHVGKYSIRGACGPWFSHLNYPPPSSKVAGKWTIEIGDFPSYKPPFSMCDRG